MENFAPVSFLATLDVDNDTIDNSILDKLAMCLLIDETRSNCIEIITKLLKQNPLIILESNLLHNLCQILRDRDKTDLLLILDCFYIVFKKEDVKMILIKDEFDILTVIVTILSDVNSNAAIINKALELLVHVSCQSEIYKRLSSEELGLIDVLINRFIKINYSDERCNSFRILWNICEFCPFEDYTVAERFLKLNLHQTTIDILNLSIDKMTFEFDMDQLFGMLMNFSRHSITRQELLRLGAVEIMIKICEDFENFNNIIQLGTSKVTKKAVQLPAYIIYAFLLGSNDIIETDKKIISTLIQILQEILNNERDEDQLGYPYGLFVLKVIMHAIWRVSLSENNKKTLLELEIVPLLYKVILNFYNKKKTTFLGGGDDDWESFEYALETLSQLSFELLQDDSIDRLISCFATGDYNIFELVDKILLDETIILPESIHRSMNDLMRSNFEMMLSRQPSMNTIGDESSDESRAHIMISYSHAKTELPRLLASELRELGWDVWVDIQGSELLRKCEQITHDCTEAIDKSGIVIVCLSENYQESPSCRRELKYSDSLGKKIVYCMLTESIKDKKIRAKWLQFIMEDDIFLDISDDLKVKETAKRISEIINDDHSLSCKLKKSSFKRKSNELLCGGGRCSSVDSSEASLKYFRGNNFNGNNQLSNDDNLERMKMAFDIILSSDNAEDSSTYDNYLKKIGLENFEDFKMILEKAPSEFQNLLLYLKLSRKLRVCDLLEIK